MKIGWGTGIFLFYLCFVLFLLLQLKKSRQYDHSLVYDNYYEYDLKYQEQYEKKANSEALLNKLAVKKDIDNKIVNVNFPKELNNINGTILFFRPSDSSLDFEVNIRPDPDNQQNISTAELRPGLWKLKIDWSAGETEFYDEAVLIL